MQKRLNDNDIFIENEDYSQLYKDIDINPEKQTYAKSFQLFLILIIFLIISILLIGYLKFHWFQYIQDNIIQIMHCTNQILNYKEKKIVNIEIETENSTDKEKKLLFHEFLLVINSKKKLNYIGEIDYLYNATIIIYHSQMDDIDVFGSNLTIDELTEEDLLNPQKVIISKFSFYEMEL